MTNHRQCDYLDHMRQAATDACGFVEAMEKADFLSDKRTQQAVIMSLIIIGEAATTHGRLSGLHLDTYRYSMA
jgi:uncharacterized protein with HEPN domain